MLASESTITLLFEKFSSFVEEYTTRLSLGGMFLRTKELRPVGSIVHFEVQLTDGFQLVSGLGEVIWVRLEDRGPDRLAGLGIRLQQLNEKGRELILKILEERVRSGEKPFDVDEIPDDVVSARGASLPDSGLPASGLPAGGDPAGGIPAEGLSARTEPEASAGSVTPMQADQAAAAAEGLPLAPKPSPEPQTPEKMILGDDGFTLLETGGSAVDEPPVPERQEFQQGEFDAPWGENLPEVPLEVLEDESPNEGGDDIDDDLTLVPSPEAPSFEADLDLTPASTPEDALGDGLLEEPGPDPSGASLFETDLSGADLPAPGLDEADLNDSFVLAAEAAEEVQIASPVDMSGEIDLDNIDFSLDSEDDESSGVDFQQPPAPGLDDVFDLDSQGPPPTFVDEPFSEDLIGSEDPTVVGSAAPMNPAPSVGEFDSIFDDGEEPTLVGAGAVESVEPEDPFKDLMGAKDLTGAEDGNRPISDPKPELSTAPQGALPLRPDPFDIDLPQEDGVVPPADPDPFSLPSPTIAAPVSTTAQEARPVEPAEVMPDGSLDPSSWGNSNAAQPSPSAGSVESGGGQPSGEIQDYEDDLFAGDTELGTGGAGKSKRWLPLIAVVLLLLAGAAYFFRDLLLGQLGFTSPQGTEVISSGARPPVPGPRAADLTDDGGRPDSTAEEPPSVPLDRTEELENVDVTETLPGLDVSSDPAADPAVAPIAAPPQAQPLGPSRVGAPASRVENCSWRHTEAGTVVTLELDGELDQQRYSYDALEYNPAREMVTLNAIVEPYLSGRIEVGTPLLERIRIGFQEGNELRVVFDFPAGGPRVAEVQHAGNRLEILIVE